MKELLDLYDAFLFDMDGVLRRGNHGIPGANETLKAIRKHEKPFLILTNDAANTPALVWERLRRAGIDASDAEILTASQVILDYLGSRFPKGSRVISIAAEGVSDMLQGIGMEILPSDDIRTTYHKANLVVVCSTVRLNFELVNAAVNAIRKYQIPLLVANSDYLIPGNNDEVRVGPGAIIEIIEKITDVKAIGTGKPFSPIFDLALKRLGVQRKNTLMVGDSLLSDIRGGSHYGLDTLLVLTGLHKEGDVEEAMTKSGIFPTYILPSVAL